jgi:hypothetical protein
VWLEIILATPVPLQRGKCVLKANQSTMANDKTFIQVAEIWIPSRNRQQLEWSSGMYGPHTDFRDATETMTFQFDEGLPGKAWAQRHPVLFTDLQIPAFLRADAARNAGLRSAVAIPVFAGDFLLAVVVLFCSDDANHVGTMELWHNDAQTSSGLTLDEGYFGHMDAFEWISRRTEFRSGFGLPGLAWQTGKPVVMADLGHSQRFVRRADALRVGINKGLAIPFSLIPGHTYVLAFLSALGTPIARRFEIWEPDAHGSLTFAGGDCDCDPDFAQAYDGVAFASGVGPLGGTLRSGLPGLIKLSADDFTPLGAAASEAGLNAMLTLPTIENGRLTSVVAMYF